MSRDEKGEEPLVVVCNDCRREFPFTNESYLDLNERMKMEYNRRLMEKEKIAVNP